MSQQERDFINLMISVSNGVTVLGEILEKLEDIDENLDDISANVRAINDNVLILINDGRANNDD
jgi:hypothetical protein